jgi:ketosteroid isomerase-like protein
MSHENIDVVAATFRKFKATQRPTGFTTPDWVWDMSAFRGWPENEQYQGDDAFMEFFAKWTEPYDQWDLEIEELVDADDDRVVIIIRQRGRLRGADSWVELRYGTVCTLADGLIERMQVFMTPKEALESAELAK